MKDITEGRGVGAHPERAAEEAIQTLERVRGYKDEFVDLLTRLCLVESPTDHPETQSEVHAILGGPLIYRPFAQAAADQLMCGTPASTSSDRSSARSAPVTLSQSG